MFHIKGGKCRQQIKPPMQTRQSSNQYTCMCLALFHLLNFCKKESLWKLNIIEIKAYTASFIKKIFILSIKLIKCLLHSWYACISQVVTTAMKLNWNHFMWYKQEYPTCKTFTTLLDTIQKKNPLKCIWIYMYINIKHN